MLYEESVSFNSLSEVTSFSCDCWKVPSELSMGTFGVSSREFLVIIDKYDAVESSNKSWFEFGEQSHDGVVAVE